MTAPQPEPTADALQGELDRVRAERAGLATGQPPGWQERYAVLGAQATELARRWEAAENREQAARWRGDTPAS